MNTEKLINGAWRVSDIVDGYLVQRVYYGYTKREAMRQFRLETVSR
jgi:hypothetical protein